LFQPHSPALVLTALLAGLAASAQAGSAKRAVPRSIVLTGEVGKAPVLYLMQGTVTVVLLDGPIVRESVEVEGRARFARVDPSEQGLMLLLQGPLEPGERLALRFDYREGVPRSAVLLLTGQPGRVDAVVNVSRPPQTVEACHAELAAPESPRRTATARVHSKCLNFLEP